MSTSSFGQEDLAALPTGSGVYLMKAQDGSVLYVGKANNLKQRVSFYFRGRDDGV